jgi:glycosyltransferase involved in cell wall biosynthesis
MYRILMIAPTSFFADYGCHVRILEEVRVLHKLKQQVKIVTYYKGRDLPGLDIERTPPVPWRTDYEVGSSRHKIVFDVLLAWQSLRAAVRYRPHLIHAHLHEGALIACALSRLIRVPVVFDFQGSLTAEMIDHKFLSRDSLAYPLWRWLEDGINHLSSVILTSSHHAADVLQTEFGVRQEHLLALPDCVNVDVFRPRQPGDEAQIAALKARWNIPPDRTVVAYLGLLAPYQGTDLLLQAAHGVLQVRRDVHFLIMGFPSVTLYQAQAEALGLTGHVTFTGRMPYDEAPAHLRLGDIAVAPKISATEGSGKLLNYMACALPTVAFDTPVNREYLGDCGIYARTGDANALAVAILQFVAAPDHGLALGQRLRPRVAARFSWDEAGQRLLSVYNGLIKQPDSARADLAQVADKELRGQSVR